MVGHGGSSAGSYLADPTSPIPSHCASIVATSTLRVKPVLLIQGRQHLGSNNSLSTFAPVLTFLGENYFRKYDIYDSKM